MSENRAGLFDFIAQRITSVLLFLYFVYVGCFLLCGDELTRASMLTFFANTPMQLFTTLAIFSIVIHSWIGLWSVGTDYLRPHYLGSNAFIIRMIYQTLLGIILFAYLVWSLQIIWGLTI